jgi:hypothetical protein
VSQLDLDLKELCAQPRFRRFLLRIVEVSGIFSPTSGASDTLPYREGQRSLGLEILREAMRGMPRGTTIPQLIALLASESTPKETDDESADLDRD